MRSSLRIALAALISLTVLSLTGSADAVTRGPNPVVHCCAK